MSQSAAAAVFRVALVSRSLNGADWHPVAPFPSLGRTRLDRAVSRLRNRRNPGADSIHPNLCELPFPEFRSAASGLRC